jgi:LytS/YehU family sensor histidine kinase
MDWNGKVEGGRVRILARVVDGRLDICVDDDGVGLGGPRRLGRPCRGMALPNIRARLRAL